MLINGTCTGERRVRCVVIAVRACNKYLSDTFFYVIYRIHWEYNPTGMLCRTPPPYSLLTLRVDIPQGPTTVTTRATRSYACLGLPRVHPACFVPCSTSSRANVRRAADGSARRGGRACVLASQLSAHQPTSYFFVLQWASITFPSSLIAPQCFTFSIDAAALDPSHSSESLGC